VSNGVATMMTLPHWNLSSLLLIMDDVAMLLMPMMMLAIVIDMPMMMLPLMFCPLMIRALVISYVT
jgi:hypothetical protein